MNTRSQLDVQSLPLLHQGKVRDIYDINPEKMLIVTTDRISAFDVIMDETIPYKGQVLNQMAKFWFEKIEDIVPNHLTHEKVSHFVTEDEALRIENRAVVVKKLTPIPIEAIVRGYLVGSGWKEYQRINLSAILNYHLDLNLLANFQKQFLPHRIKLRWVPMMKIFQWQRVLN